ncbi:MAG TPA: type VI secretion system protein TssL, partial [Sphingomonas sanguinis]|nr:type VI secretion system protein TssL [Sphingomonas sanguinis]
MSEDGDKTVFRPSPLQGLKRGDAAGAPPPPPAAPWGSMSPPPPGQGPAQGYAAPPPLTRTAAPVAPGPVPSRLGEDDVPLPATPPAIRNIMLAEAE